MERSRRLHKLRKPLAGALSAAAIASCSTGARTATEHTPSPTTKAATSIKLVPNMVGFLAAGSSDTCRNGGARPCALLIRTEAKLSADFVNADPAQTTVAWPLEAYNGQAGDQVTVECYDPNGQTITPYEGNSSSSAWYEVVVPERHVLNPTVNSELKTGNPTLKTIQLRGQTAVLGWASVEWFNQAAPVTDVPICHT